MKATIAVERFSISDLPSDGMRFSILEAVASTPYHVGFWGEALGIHLTERFFGKHSGLRVSVETRGSNLYFDVEPHGLVASIRDLPQRIGRDMPEALGAATVLASVAKDLVAQHGPALRASMDRHRIPHLYRDNVEGRVCEDAGRVLPFVDVPSSAAWGEAVKHMDRAASPLVAPYARDMYRTFLEDLANVRGRIFDAKGRSVYDAPKLSRALSDATCDEMLRREAYPVVVTPVECADPTIRLHSYDYLAFHFGLLAEDVSTGLWRAAAYRDGRVEFTGAPRKRVVTERMLLRRGMSAILK